MTLTRREFFAVFGGAMLVVKIPPVRRDDYAEAQAIADRWLREAMSRTVEVSYRPKTYPRIGQDFFVDGSVQFAGRITGVSVMNDGTVRVTALDSHL